MGIAQNISRRLAPRAGQLAPGPTSQAIHRALAQAIAGVGPLDSAAEIAEKHRRAAGGDTDRAIASLIGTHLKLAAAQGFLTNLGGLVTLAVTLPANIAGLALLQCRLVAAIAYLRGYDLADASVRNGVLASILGEADVRAAVKKKKLPGTPQQIAAGTAGAGVADLDRVVAAQVVAGLITSVAGKRVATTVGKRVPVIGGAIGAGTDALSTRAVGHYAEQEFKAR